MTKIALALACLIGTAPLAQAQDATSDPWSPLRFLVGEWRGAITGEQGTGMMTRRYRLILSGEFLQERSMANFPPQPQNTDGAVFNYASFLRYDRTRKAFLFRQFHQEHVNGTFIFSTTQSHPTRVVFESVQLDNAPATWKARETLDVISADEYVETFETADGDKPFTVRSRIQFKRRLP